VAYLEDIPAEMLLTEHDVSTCRQLFLPGGWVSVQLQQPPAAAFAAVTGAHRAGCKVVLDGAPADAHWAALLAMADIPVLDTTGAGDAFTAALITALAQDGSPAVRRQAGGRRGRSHPRPSRRPAGADTGRHPAPAEFAGGRYPAMTLAGP
jgi:sugar/nucleoside kinase (ribokinase family)